MSIHEFKNFHNEVFNLPRDSFSNFNIIKLKSLAEYLFAINDKFPSEGLKIAEIYLSIHNFLQNNEIEHKNEDFEYLFDLDLTEIRDIKRHYESEGRKFRHWMELASLLELLDNFELGNNRSRRILTSFTEELHLAPENLVKSLIRDKILSINTKTNPGLGNLSSYDLYKDLDYRPAMAILKYMNKIGRPCTRFELSIFFGRPDYNFDSDSEIVADAIEQGEAFPTSESEQIEYYFRFRNWIYRNGQIYLYNASQQPYFKFNLFFIMMEAVGLIDYNSDTLTLTDFSRSLFSTKTLSDTIELEILLDEFENDDEIDLAEKITKNRSSIIEKMLKEDESFLERANQRAAAKSGTTITVTQTTETRKRDQLIREISKQQANYTCQGCGRETFRDKRGNNFVESHHIIEYNSKEDGPDVLQNLLVLCPNCHSKIHFGKSEIIQEFYENIRKTNVITLEQFRELCSMSLLKQKHVDLLIDKKIITKIEAKELIELLETL